MKNEYILINYVEIEKWIYATRYLALLLNKISAKPCTASPLDSTCLLKGEVKHYQTN